MFKKIFQFVKQITSFLFKLARLAIVIGAPILILSRALTGMVGWFHTYSESDAPTRPVAIVFGAGLTRSGDASPILKDRVQTGAKLYFAGKVQKLLLTGDNSFATYNEPEAMRRYALSLGVPEEAIVLDYAGRRTYDSCYRAKEIFGVQEAILVTQAFHMHRAIYLCRALGMDGVGVISENINYRRFSLVYWNIRELAATVNALVDVHITRPLPILGDPEPIFQVRGQ